MTRWQLAIEGQYHTTKDFVARLPKVVLFCAGTSVAAMYIMVYFEIMFPSSPLWISGAFVISAFVERFLARLPEEVRAIPDPHFPGTGTPEQIEGGVDHQINSPGEI